MAVVKSKLGRFSLFLANPMVAKLDKVEESGEPSCQANSIIAKTLFLLLLTILGVAGFFIINAIVPGEALEVENYSVKVVPSVIMIVALLIGGIGTWISFKFVRSAVFFGAIYSFAQGYSIALISNIFGMEYVYPCLIALGITIFIIAVMLFLYRLKLVRIDRKFVSVILTLITVGIFLALGVFIMNMIPATQHYAQYIIDNSVLVTICGSVGIIIASLFLLIDFEVINHSLEAKLPKKYEWLSAFALSFSIIELYLKILNFLLQVMQNNSNSN